MSLKCAICDPDLERFLMSESLAIYLHDHLTGASMAIELLESRQKEEYVGAPLGEFAASLQIEVDGDRVVLRALAERTGAGPAPVPAKREFKPQLVR
jgi:hypothetical protein